MNKERQPSPIRGIRRTTRLAGEVVLDRVAMPMETAILLPITAPLVFPWGEFATNPRAAWIKLAVNILVCGGSVWNTDRKDRKDKKINS